MATITAQKRLTKEYKALSDEPTPYIYARPDEQNILEWHYIITGPPGTPYEGGQYHGMLLFPPTYPFKPPGITMITPNGRFQTNKRLCLTISDYHPESWNPAWSVGTILVGLLSFMTGNEGTTGTIKNTEKQKIALASQSKTWNATKNTKFMKILADFAYKDSVEEKSVKELEEARQKRRNDLKRKLECLSAGDSGSKALDTNNAVSMTSVDKLSAGELVEVIDISDEASPLRKMKCTENTTIIDTVDLDAEDDVVESPKHGGHSEFEDDFYDDFEVSDAESFINDVDADNEHDSAAEVVIDSIKEPQGSTGCDSVIVLD